MKTHQIYKHTKNFPYACKQCDRGFISPGQRHEHVVRTHLKLSSSSGSRSKNKSSKTKSNQRSHQTQTAQQQQQRQQQRQQSANSTNNLNNSNVNVELVQTSDDVKLEEDGNTVTLVNATILQPVDASTQSGQIESDELPPGSTITLAIQAIPAPDSDDSLTPSMSSAACQTALSLPPLL